MFEHFIWKEKEVFPKKIPFGSPNALSFEHLMEWITKLIGAYRIN